MSNNPSILARNIKFKRIKRIKRFKSQITMVMSDPIANIQNPDLLVLSQLLLNPTLKSTCYLSKIEMTLIHGN